MAKALEGGNGLSKQLADLLTWYSQWNEAYPLCLVVL